MQDAGVPKTGRILDIGCGNSVLCKQLKEAGYMRVVGIDFSAVVIEQMRQQELEHKEQGQGRLHYFTMDATNLSFSDASFDAVVDKGGLDSILANYDRVQMWKKLKPDKPFDPEGALLVHAHSRPKHTHTRSSLSSSLSYTRACAHTHIHTHRGRHRWRRWGRFWSMSAEY